MLITERVFDQISLDNLHCLICYYEIISDITILMRLIILFKKHPFLKENLIISFANICSTLVELKPLEDSTMMLLIVSTKQSGNRQIVLKDSDCNVKK
jgi:hypothetical protein